MHIKDMNWNGNPFVLEHGVIGIDCQASIALTPQMIDAFTDKDLVNLCRWFASNGKAIDTIGNVREYGRESRHVESLTHIIETVDDDWTREEAEKAYHQVSDSIQEWAQERERKTKKRVIPTALRKIIFERDAYRCQHCSDWHDLTVDHIIPECAGGDLDPRNLQTLCKKCNSRKGTKIPKGKIKTET